MSEAHHLAMGTEFAGLKITGLLGQGGFGITYKASDEQDGQIYALKEFFPYEDAMRTSGVHVAAKPGREDRFELGYKAFLDEARTLNALPPLKGLVRIEGAFTKHGTVYAKMEFINGEPLDVAARQVIARIGHVPEALIKELIGSLLNALSAVHRVGVLHRDIKPGNVMIGRDNQPVLIDFGAARPMSGAPSMSSMFSRRYAALEQFPKRQTGYSARQADGPRIDIFGVSILLYELVSQSLPPDAGNRYQTLKKTGRDPYLPVRDNIHRNRVTVRYPDVLLDMIDKGCALFPEHRFTNAQDMSDFLGAFISMPKARDADAAFPTKQKVQATNSADQSSGRTQKSRWAVFGLILLLTVGGVVVGML